MRDNKPKDGRVWMDEIQAQAKADFAQHKMKEIGPGHWHIRKPDTGIFWCDIVVMGNVGLAVWGGIEGCFFSYYSGAKGPRQLVAWMGNADVGYYGKQKAHIGMGGGELVEEYVDEVALYDLDQALEQREEEYDPEDWNEPRSDGPSPRMIYTDAFSDVRAVVNNGEDIRGALAELCDTLMRAGVDDTPYEWAFSIGQVTSCRVIYALAAVSRLNELLLAQDSGDLETSQL